MGNFSIEQLRTYKTAYSGARARGEVPIDKPHLLARLGGVYSAGDGIQVAVSGQPTVSFRRLSADRLLLSFVIRDVTQRVLLRVDENMIVVDPGGISDLSVRSGANRIRLWLPGPDLGLDFAFLPAVTTAQLTEILNADRARIDETAREGRDRIGEAVQAWARGHADTGGTIALVDFKRLSLFRRNGEKINVRNSGVQVGGNRLSYSFSYENGGPNYGF